jgi:predicted peptidase
VIVHYATANAMERLPHYRYLVDGLPPSGERKPLLLFLHGKGERGSNPNAVRAHGPPHVYPKYGLDRFIVVSPQCPEDQKWDAAQLENFLVAFCRRHPVDVQRIYLTGLSLGGEGAWHLLSRCPERYSASVLICGRGDPTPVRNVVARVKKPTWLIHSAGDSAVPVACSDGLFDALRSVSAPVTYTRYAALGHVQTWQEAYHDRLLFDWLLRHPSPE